MIEVAITEKEGGHLVRIFLRMRKKDIVKELFDSSNWIEVNGEKLTRIRDGYINYLFQSILFKNGYIWDSEFRTWRHEAAKKHHPKNYRQFIHKWDLPQVARGRLAFLRK